MKCLSVYVLCVAGQGNKNMRKGMTKGKVMKNVEICRHLISFYFPSTNEKQQGFVGSKDLQDAPVISLVATSSSLNMNAFGLPGRVA